MKESFTIILGGVTAGSLDILSAFASYTSQGATVEGILKYIASGLVGPAAMQGGIAMAWLGLLIHFALTTIMTAVFMYAASKQNFLAMHAWFSGVIYGVITWVVMVYIAVPLSAVVGWKLPTGWKIVSGLLAHIFYVGVPIAHIARFGLRDVAMNNLKK